MAGNSTSGLGSAIEERESGAGSSRPRAVGEGDERTAARSGITIEASTDAGLLYGAVTAWQLATGDKPNVIPGVTIRDHPRFRWRGLMLDSARHFQSPEFIRKLIDWM